MNEKVMRKHYEATPKETLINILISSREQVDKLQNRNKEHKQEIERLHSIIKEVREYIKKYRTMVDGYEDEKTGQMIYEHRLKLNKHQVRKLLEILDKENK